MAGGKNDAPALAAGDAGASAAKSAAGAAAHFDKHQRAVAVTHNQIDLTATAPRRSIIALQQTQARRLQMGQRPVFGRSTALARTVGRSGCFFTKEFH